MHNRNISRRRFLQGMGGVLGVTTLAACAPVTQAPAQTETEAGESAPAADNVIAIEYWHRQGGDRNAIFEEFNTTFTEQHDGQYTVMPIYQGNITDLNRKVRAAAAGGGLPGAVMGDDYDITQYAFSGILVDLDTFIDDPEIGLTNEQISDILPNEFNRHKLEIYDNQRMAFPQSFSSFATWANMEALEALGMERPPESWDDFPAHAREISAANGDVPAWLISGAGDRFISTLLTYGVEWLKPGGEESNFDAPEALEIMTWWRELSDEGLLAVDGEARNAFIAQQNMYYMDSSANVDNFAVSVEDFTWYGFMPPQRTPEGSDPVTETYGPVNAVPVTDEDSQTAGWLWLKFLVMEPEIHARWVTQSTYFPSTHSATESETLAAFYEENPISREMREAIAPYARILAPSPALPEVRGVITANAVQEVLLQQLSPEEGVAKLKAEADAAIRNAMG
jgi:multiple sugar transport system substrate-binding protein